jgi:hypothetical protein
MPRPPPGRPPQTAQEIQMFLRTQIQAQMMMQKNMR